MTNEEIKKALECCISYKDGMCKHCPNYDYKHEDCMDDVKRQALDLINEYEKEIKKQNGCVKCLKTRLANKMVLLSNIEDLYESEIQKLKANNQELTTTLKQSEDNYSRAFERLKSQQRDIDILKADIDHQIDATNDAENLASHLQYDCDKEIKARVKQAQIDVLNNVKDILANQKHECLERNDSSGYDAISECEKYVGLLFKEVENEAR